MVELFLWMTLAILFAVVAGGLGSVVWILLREGRTHHNDTLSVQGSFANVLLGQVAPRRDKLRDPRVAQGFVVDIRTGRLELQGKLSDEYVGAVLKK